MGNGEYDLRENFEENGISEIFLHSSAQKELILPETGWIVKDESGRILVSKTKAEKNVLAICVFSTKLIAKRFVQLQGLEGNFFYQSFTWDNIVKDFSKLYGKICLNPLNKFICDGFVPICSDMKGGGYGNVD